MTIDTAREIEMTLRFINDDGDLEKDIKMNMMFSKVPNVVKMNNVIYHRSHWNWNNNLAVYLTARYLEIE